MPDGKRHERSEGSEPERSGQEDWASRLFGGGGGREGDGPPPRRANLLLWILIGLALAFTARGVVGTPGAKHVPYSRFKEAVRQERFEKVVLHPERAVGVPAGDADGGDAGSAESGAEGGDEAGREASSDEADGASDEADGASDEAGGASEAEGVSSGGSSSGGGAGKPLPTRLEERWWAHRVPEDESLVELLDERGVTYRFVPESDLWRFLLVWLLPIGLLLAVWIFVMRRMSGGMGGRGGLMGFGKSRARVHAEHDTGVSFQDVEGIQEAVEELQEIVSFLQHPERYRRLGGQIPKGALLVGPPGTGKTLLGRAVAGEAGVPFFSLSGSEFMEMFVGVGAARVRDLFKQAQQRAPAIIFIDELDALGKARGPSGMPGGHDEREQTLNQLLAEMDGFDSQTGLIVLSATNRPEVLDPALLRPGRFDRHIMVDRPDREGRRRILGIHAKDVQLADDVDLDRVAQRTPGFAGADLANVVNEAALLAARQEAEAVHAEDFEAAIERVVAGLQKKNRRMNPEETRTVAYHESGHALVSHSLPHADPVHKISIVPRGMGALGYTMQFPLEDRYLLREDELRDRLAGLLGGRAAEELVFGRISSGASDDLRKATETARVMVLEYGMSEAIGPLNLRGEQRSPLQSGGSGTDGAAGRPQYSERTAEVVDEEVKRIVGEALDRARSVLRERRDVLEALATRLHDQEVLEREDLEELAGPPASASETEVADPRSASTANAESA